MPFDRYGLGWYDESRATLHYKIYVSNEYVMPSRGIRSIGRRGHLEFLPNGETRYVSTNVLYFAASYDFKGGNGVNTVSWQQYEHFVNEDLQYTGNDSFKNRYYLRIDIIP